MEKYDIVVVIIAILGLVGTFYSMFYKPLHKLEIAINLLNNTLDHNNTEITNLKDRVSIHGDEIDKHQSILDRNGLK